MTMDLMDEGSLPGRSSGAQEIERPELEGHPFA